MFKAVIISVFLLLAFHGEGYSQEVKKQKKTVSTDKTGWHSYSLGIHYKTIKDYEKAIRYFTEAAAHNEELDKVYYQLAECYFNLNDNEKAVRNAEESIAKNKTFAKPYILLHEIYLKKKNYSKAASVLESLLGVKSGLVNVHYTLGTLYYNNRDYDRALYHFNRIIEISSTQLIDEFYKEYAYYHAGHIYYGKNQIDKSIQSFRIAADINPDNTSTIYILSVLFMENYRLEEALKYCHQYLSKIPDNLKINSYIGRIYYIMDDPKAWRYLKKAGSEVSVDGFLSRALAGELERQDEDAVKALKFLVEKQPKLITPHLALGKIYSRRNDGKSALGEYFTAGILLYEMKVHNQARENLLKVISLNDKIPEAYYYMGKSYEDTNQLAMAVVYYKKADDLRGDVELLIHIGYLLAQRKEYGESVRYFDMAIDKEPNNHKSYFFKGLAYSFRDNFLLAEKFMKKAIDIDKNDTYYFHLAIVLEKQNKIEETIESLKRAIKYNPNNARACNYLGYLYADRNMRIGESIELIQKALKLEPLNGAYLDSLGWAYYRKGEYAAALKTLLDAEKQLETEKAPDSIVYDHIGDTYSRMGEKKKAMDYWKKSFRLDKNPKVEKKINSIKE
jgi:tetratricopeptide (TPR) repeat protein